jgi:prostaglandin-endoperoxide synthase 2
MERRMLERIGPLYRYPPVRRFVSGLVIDKYGKATSPRPRALSMASDYTSWRSLTDRSFSGRHLPPASAPSGSRPTEAEVTALFRRENQQLSTDTRVAFMFFAQWFTDSFLRTSRGDFRKTSSNHEIDLCQLYGLSADKTALLREHRGGRMKSQIVDGAEYPRFLFRPRRPGAPLVVEPEFDGLHDPAVLADLLRGTPPEREDAVFAVGLEYGNSTIGHAMLNTMFLREHNRVAAILAQEHPRWDDDRLFETTRNILIVLLLKIVIEDYIGHIGPEAIPIELVPFAAEKQRWNRPNWISIEFNLLYRWHSLVPDMIGTGPDGLEPTEFLNNNSLVMSRGVEPLIELCSQTRAGRIGLRNTPAFLVDPPRPGVASPMERTTSLMRNARLSSYNDYRDEFGLGRLTGYDELTADTDLAARLESLYGDIDNLEWYVGLFAEDHPEHMMMGELMGTMVGYDAFTQALTNPLLARNVFNEATFTPTGMRLIDETHSLQQIFERNSPSEVHVSFRC